jgi:DNA-binding transcriptional MerR regulator
MMFQTFPAGLVSARDKDAMQQTFTSNEVIALTAITPRQLQWWDERGIVAPSREGHKRVYSLDDLAEVAIICDLRRRGFSLQKIRTVIRFLQKELGKRLVDIARRSLAIIVTFFLRKDKQPLSFPAECYLTDRVLTARADFGFSKTLLSLQSNVPATS